MALAITYTFATQSGNVPASELDTNFNQILGYFNTALPQALAVSPATGVALTLNAAAGSAGEVIHGVTGSNAIEVNSPAGSNVSFGADISAGTTASDYGLRIKSAAGAVQWVFDGLGTLNQVDSANTVIGISNGNTGSIGSGSVFEILVPAAGNGIYLVAAALVTASTSPNFLSVALVTATNGTVVVTYLVPGSQVSISNIAGNNLYVSQSSGTTQAGGINYNVMRIV